MHSITSDQTFGKVKKLDEPFYWLILSVTIKPIKLIVIMIGVIMLTVLAP